MRKILYTSGYGAGWSSWHSGSKEEKLFMLEYAPLIEAIEEGQKFPYRRSALIAEALDKFAEDWESNFPDSDLPYLGGSDQLQVKTVQDGALVRIHEHDGSERVETIGEFDDWI